MIFRDGWLPAGHARPCCQRELGYNIRMGARKSVGTVPRQHGDRHAAGRRKLFRPGGRSAPGISPSTWGRRGEVLLPLRSGPRSRRQRRAHRPLLWRDGWPVAGANVVASAARSAHGHRARARRAGFARRRTRGRGGRGGPDRAISRRTRRPNPGAAGRARRAIPAPPPAPIPAQDASQVSATGPQRHRCGWPMHTPGAAEVEHRAGVQCRRLPGSRSSRSRSPERI
jgi:arabinan endo-1,5-alpha-L-arabinosidase